MATTSAFGSAMVRAKCLEPILPKPMMENFIFVSHHIQFFVWYKVLFNSSWEGKLIKTALCLP